MQGDRTALPAVRDLHLEAQNVRELPFKRLEVGIGGLRVLASDTGGGRPALRPTGSLLGLSHGEILGDDLPSELIRIVSGGNSPCMPHADIAFQ